jgi:hypothetical protein
MRKTFFFSLFVISFLYLFPFYKYLKGDLTIGYIASSIIVNRRIDKNQSDSLKALILFNYVTGHLKYPAKNHLPIDDNCFQILKNQYASCDQQSDVLIYLASLSKLDGRLLFLYGRDSVSRHSVSEIKIGNKYRVFCPYFKKVFYNSSNELATMSDIQNRDLLNKRIVNPPNVKLSQTEYYQLFDTLFPFKVFKNNKKELIENESFERLYFDQWYSIVGDFGFRPLFRFIAIHSDFNLAETEKLSKLLFEK